MNDMPGRHRYQPPPPMPPTPAPPPSPAAAGRSFRLIMLGLIGGAILAGPTGFAMGAAAEKASSRGTGTAVSASVPEKTRTPSPSPSPTRRKPTKSDFKVTLKELSRDCFGSAGCSITYRPRLTMPSGLDPDTTYEITYRIRGGDSPETGTIRLADGQYERSEDTIGTPAGAKLTAVVTDVEAL